MGFNSEQERLDDPQARLISIKQWQTYFNGDFTSIHRNLMTASWKEALGNINTEADENTKFAFFICLSKNPQVNNVTLKSAAQHRLKLTTEQCMFAAIVIGRLTIFQECFAKLSPYSHRAKLFTHIMRFYSPGFLHFLQTNKSLPNVAKKLTTEGFYNVIDKGGIDDLLLFNQLLPREKMQMFIRANDYQAFLIAEQNRNVALMHFLMENCKENRETILGAQNYAALPNAVITHHHGTMAFLIEQASSSVITKNMLAALDTRIPTMQEDISASLDYVLKKILTPDIIINCRNNCSTTSGICLVREALKLPHIYRHLQINPNGIPGFRSLIYDFYIQELSALYQRFNHHENQKEDNEFDVDASDARLWLHLIHFIIARNYCVNSQDLEFLLSIPAIAAIAHTPVIEPYPNALLIIAHRHKNYDAKELLLKIPAVKKIFEKNYSTLQSAVGLEQKHSFLCLGNSPDLLLLIEANQYELIRQAVGNLEKLQAIMAVPGLNIPKVLEAYNSIIFRHAIIHGNCNTIEFLLQSEGEAAIWLLKADYYGCFRLAAEHNYDIHFDCLYNYGIKQSGFSTTDMLRAMDFAVFHAAARNGNNNLLQFLLAQAPYLIRIEMLQSRQFQAFHAVISSAKKKAIAYLAHHASLLITDFPTHQNSLKWGQSQADFCIDKLLAIQPFREIIMRDSAVLNNHEVFAYINRLHFNEYRETLEFFVKNKITYFVNQTKVNRHIMAKKEIQLCLKLIHFIICHHSTGLDSLLTIPKLSKQAHDKNNYLLRLAFRRQNKEAVQLLMSISSVRNLARMDNYYPQEAQGMLDFYLLSHDKESSMRMLSPQEEQCLRNLYHHYHPIISQQDEQQLLKELRRDLEQRYTDNPATIYTDKQNIALPLTMETLQTLNLSKENYALALKAYYQHRVHSAWRYLLIPNPWMAENASYVYINEAHTERWAIFEGLEGVITLLWVAAKDSDCPPTEGCLEDRINDFITALAQMARAHNWDNTRVRKDKDGNILYDKLGNPSLEEYDDFSEGDRPTCFSGAKPRLFHSIRTHSLLRPVTEEVIQLEIHEFVVAHFKEVFKPEKHYDALQIAINRCIIEGEPLPADLFLLFSELNISLQKTSIFITKLEEKYGWEIIRSFTDFILNQFNFPEHNEYPNKRFTHLFNFFSTANLEAVLLRTTVPNITFFAPRQSEQTTTTTQSLTL